MKDASPPDGGFIDPALAEFIRRVVVPALLARLDAENRGPHAQPPVESDDARRLLRPILN